VSEQVSAEYRADLVLPSRDDEARDAALSRGFVVRSAEYRARVIVQIREAEHAAVARETAALREEIEGLRAAKVFALRDLAVMTESRDAINEKRMALGSELSDWKGRYATLLDSDERLASQLAAARAERRSDWVRMKDGVPPRGEWVLCERRWTDGSATANHGQQLTEVVMARREASCMPNIRPDVSEDCFWHGDNGSSFSDATVSAWRLLDGAKRYVRAAPPPAASRSPEWIAAAEAAVVLAEHMREMLGGPDDPRESRAMQCCYTRDHSLVRDYRNARAALDAAQRAAREGDWTQAIDMIARQVRHAGDDSRFTATRILKDLESINLLRAPSAAGEKGADLE
jgi:hypothetical protein